MSVLVEAICIVIRRTALDRKFPGGADAFVSYARSRRSAEHRYVFSDSHLVCLSYFTPDAADRGTEPLVKAGLVEIEDDEYVDFAIVDQHYGPALPCLWIAWHREAIGYTRAWLAGELPGELVVPEGWIVEHSHQLTRIDIGKIPDRALKLSDEQGFETWLDFQTGRINRIPSRL